MDLGAAFDTADDLILLKHLVNWVCLSGSALNWFKFYLKDRNFYVSVGNFKSETKTKKPHAEFLKAPF